MNKKYLLFLGIIILAAFLRLWQLGTVPPSPDWDEVALGYNAQSILETGKDEYGKSFPIVLQSFNDYKPAFYVYLIIPFLLLFDLSVVAVRLPSAVFGIIAVIATYFLVREIINTKFESRSSKQIRSPEVGNVNQLLEIGNWRLEIPLVAMLLMAISPWHMQFSRIGFEANIALTFVILFFLFFLKGIKRPWYLLLSAFCAGLTLYIYQSAKVFTPMFALVLVIIFLKELWKLEKKWLIAAAVVGALTILPMALYILTTPDALIRAKGLSIFQHDPVALLQHTSQRLILDKQNNDYLGLLFDNRRVVFAKQVISGYLSHFNPVWLLITGDNLRHHAPFMGMLYIVELPFLLWGVYAFSFSNISRKLKFAVFAQFLITPIPASITFDIPSAVRTINFLPTFQIFTAFGIVSALVYILSQKDVWKKVISMGLGIVMMVLFAYNIGYYLNQYFVQQNYYASQNWQYGYKDAVETVRKIESHYDKIVVESRSPMDQSYMFFLYYLDYPVREYQKVAGNGSGSFDASHAYGKYEFRAIDWGREEKNDTILYVGLPSDFPNNISTIKSIDFLDGKPAIKIVPGNAQQQ